MQLEPTRSEKLINRPDQLRLLCLAPESTGFSAVRTRTEWNFSWPAQYCAGWTLDQAIYVNRPKQKVSRSPRFEDLNHAGISLLGMEGAGALSDFLDDDQTAAVGARLKTLFSSGTVPPRDIDGAAHKSPRWMPGAHSSDQHLTYANLHDPEGAFELTLTLAHCTSDGCASQEEWDYGSAEAFLTDNPLFTFTKSDER